MRIVMTGGAGFIGRRLAQRLLRDGRVTRADGTHAPLEKLTLFDVKTVDDAVARDARVEEIVGDIRDFATVLGAVAPDTACVFHFGAVVSAGAEADFDLGIAVNLDGTRNVLEACRRLTVPARFIFASSLAVYGGDLPPVIDDATPLYPQTSYGTHKACGELLVSDYSRKGYVDGRALRFPTILVRPEPNLAASTFASTIIRDSLAGRDALCPVTQDSVMAVMSVHRLLTCIASAAELPAAAFGARRALLLPAISVSVAALIDGVRRAGGEAAAGRITVAPDAMIQEIVDGWPRGVKAERALGMGLSADATIDEIIDAYTADDLHAMS